MADTVVREKPHFHLQVLFTEEFYSVEVTSMRYSRDITPNCHNCYNLCCLQVFLYLFIFIDKINLFDCCIPAYCIFIIFILYLFLFIVNQYMYPKFK